MTKNDKTRFTLRMPTFLYDEVQEIADKTGMTRNTIIVQLIRKT